MIADNIPVALPPMINIQACYVPIIYPRRPGSVQESLMLPNEKELVEKSFPKNLKGKVFKDLYLDKLIASGNFGVFFRAIDLETGKYYGIKLFFDKLNVKFSFDRELNGYKLLSSFPYCSEYIPCLYDYGKYDVSKYLSLYSSSKFKKMYREKFGSKKIEIVKDDYFFLQTDLLDLDLFVFIQMIRFKNWTEKHPKVVLRMVELMIRAVDFIHSRNLAHFDIKPENYLLKFLNVANPCQFIENPKEFELKLGDLGYVCTGKAKILSDKIIKCTNIATPALFSPEMALHFLYHRGETLSLITAQKADIWSLGISIAELIYKPKDFTLNESMVNFLETGNEEAYVEAFNKYTKSKVKYRSKNKKINEALNDIVTLCLRYDPKDRPTADELLQLFNFEELKSV
jgi:serine/threonine protein kinase